MSNGHLNWQYNSAVLDNSPAIADGKIFASSKSMLMCFDAATGSSVWNTSFPDSRMGPLYYSSPAVADGMVFVHSCASANNFLCINATTGHIVWSSTVGSYDFCSSPAVADGRVFIGADDGKLYCFNAVNGEIIWSYHTGDNMRASPIVAYGNVYVDSTLASGFSPTGQVYAFGAVPLAKTILSLSLSSQTSLGFSVGLNGNLLMENQSAVSNAPIKFSYSINDGSSWTDISLTYTSTDGSYSVLWTPSATGVFLVKASYAGLYPYQSSQTSVQLSVLPYNNQYVFAVSSNSTVPSLAFNSQSNTLSFNVSGPSGTTGYVDMQIAKNLVSNIANLVITLDGNSLAYTVTSTSDSYLLHFSYTHSAHAVSIDLGASSTQKPTTLPTANPTPVMPEIYAAIIIILILAISLIFVIYKKRSSKFNRG